MLLLDILASLFSAALAGLGVGSGGLLVIYLTLIAGIDQQTAQGINLLFFLPTALSALILHAKQGFLDKPTLKAAIPSAVLAALAGAWIATAVCVSER